MLGAKTTKRALLVGHFSTVGDIESLYVIRAWLDDVGLPYDMAPFKKKIRERMSDVLKLSEINPDRYSHLVMICGPVWKEQLAAVPFKLSRFKHCVRIGINLTMVDALDVWNPFDVLLERDADQVSRPDLTFLSETESVPVIGRCMVKKQSSYTDREQHEAANTCFNDLIERRDFAVIDLDTRWFRTKNGLKTPAHFLSALKRVDLLLTNRLHGMVYAIKAGVPVIAIDAIEGGAKVTAQAKAIDWPQCFSVQEATPERLDAAVKWCFSAEAKEKVLSCRKKAFTELLDIKSRFLAAVTLENGSSSDKEIE